MAQIVDHTNEATQTLFTVGPVAHFPRTLEIMRQEPPYNRTLDFAQRTRKIINNLKHLLGTSGEVLILTCSGTGAMEAAIGAFFGPSNRVLVVAGGVFGQRWVDLSRRFGIDVINLDPPIGAAVDPVLVGTMLDRYACDGLIVTAHETSTGVLHDVHAIGEEAKSRGVFFLVDAISTVLADPFVMDEWGIDAAVLSSPKGLALPPGLAFVAVGNRAIQKIERIRPLSLYFDLREYLRNQERGQIPFTPAISLLLVLEDRLQHIFEHGLSFWHQQSASLATSFRRNIADLPLKQVPTSPSNALTALHCLAALPAIQWVDFLRAQYGFYVSPNGDGSGFRIGHMGNQTQADLDKLVDALRAFCVLNEVMP